MWLLIVGVVFILMGNAGWTILHIDGALQVVGGVMVAVYVISWLYSAYIIKRVADEEEEKHRRCM